MDQTEKILFYCNQDDLHQVMTKPESIQFSGFIKLSDYGSVIGTKLFQCGNNRKHLLS